MSTKSKLLAMTENLQLPEVDKALLMPSATQGGHSAIGARELTPPGTKFPPILTNGAAPRTGPGQMLAFRGQMLAAEGELGRLKGRLEEHEGSIPTRRLDPQTIVPSRWANRHQDSFSTAEFASLKQDIELAGGNVQPISVRRLADQPGKYEIVFGHRRHRACSELGIPVLATIDDVTISDHELFTAMDRENRERADLSPFEQGTMYRRALDEQLYASNRRLGEALGVSHTWVANVLMVADLPAPVVACFRSPLEIQHRHAKALSGALEADRKGVLRRAERIRTVAPAKPPAAVVAALLGRSVEATERSKQQDFEVDGKVAGRWSQDEVGRLTVQIDPSYVSEGRHVAVLESIATALKR